MEQRETCLLFATWLWKSGTFCLNFNHDFAIIASIFA